MEKSIHLKPNIHRPHFFIVSGRKQEKENDGEKPPTETGAEVYDIK